MMIKFTLYGNPVTKKNSQRILMTRTGRPFIMPSKQYEQYRRDCLRQITGDAKKRIEKRVNVKYLFYMGTRRKVDLTNLEEALDDILVDAGVLADDNSRIVAAHDGSRVLYSKENPRVEIEIEEMEG